MLALQALTPEQLQAALPVLTLGEARRVVSAVSREQSLQAPVERVRRVALEAVRAAGALPTLTRLAERQSAVDPFRKLLLMTSDGQRLETVRIPLEKPGRFSVCVSSQVGCALACSFCATGRLGLQRNLETWEIVEQVRLVRRGLDPALEQRVHGVVFQGMGEPLANLDRVIEAVRVFMQPSGMAIDARCVTVCTAGLPTGIRRLSQELPQVRLGLSLGSARPEVRERLMPISRTHPLARVLDAAVEHATLTGRAPLWALTLLAGVNDGVEEAVALAALYREFTQRAGVRPRLSLIPYNSISTDRKSVV